MAEARPSGAAWADRLRSILATGHVLAVTALWTTACILVFSLPTFLVVKLATGWSREKVVRLMIWLYGRGWILLTFPTVRVRRRGFSGLSAALPCIAVMNHLSFFDTFFMACLPFSNVSFAVRAWPFKMFWYAGFMRMANYLEVESEPWERTLERGRRALEGGGCVFFFPEGHRSRTGDMGRFGSGAFKMAVQTGYPILPLVIEGTGQLLPPETIRMMPSKITITALPLARPGSMSHKGLCEHVRSRMRAIQKKARRDFGPAEGAAAEGAALPMDSAAVLPHGLPMRVVDRLIEKGPDHATGEVIVGEDSLFLGSGGRLEATALVEMIAQTFAMGQGYEDLVKGGSVSDGFLVGIREARFAGTARAGDRLLVRVRRAMELGEFSIAEGEVWREDALLVSASLKFWLPAPGAGSRGGGS